MKITNMITKQLDIRYPIIQAPMAGGITTADLVIKSAENGVLGMIGAGYLSAQSLRAQIKEIKASTDKPFGVNVFVPGEFQAELEQVKFASELLQPYYSQYGIDFDLIKLPTPKESMAVYEEQMNVLLEEQVSAVSFTFGLPSEKWLKRFKELHIPVLGTATSLKEAIDIEKSEMDMVVVQGIEAGGHSGAFHEVRGAELTTLVSEISAKITIPIIAAGGIMNGKDMFAVLQSGAQAVQMGTAFLLTEESGAHSMHKRAILDSKKNDTIITKAFSGKAARGLKNTFIDHVGPFEDRLPSFPVMNTLTQPIRKKAKENQNSEWMSLWSGANGYRGRLQSVNELILQVINEMESLIAESDNMNQ